MLSCENCIHREVCKFYDRELLLHNYYGKDFIKELKKLRKLLAKGCKSYKEIG